MPSQRGDLGVVGAGGLGTEIDLSIRYFEYLLLSTAFNTAAQYFLVGSREPVLKSATRWSVGAVAVVPCWVAGL